jgi:hypothetical protein
MKTSVAEPEPQGAASFGRSRSRKAMQLRLRLRQWCLSWLGIKMTPILYQFITHLAHIFSDINRSESNEEDSFNMCLNLSSF